MRLQDYYDNEIKPLSEDLARTQTYKAVSGITHIYVKDGDTIREFKYECWDCLEKNDYSFQLCANCQTQRVIREITI